MHIKQCCAPLYSSYLYGHSGGMKIHEEVCRAWLIESNESSSPDQSWTGNRWAGAVLGWLKVCCMMAVQTLTAAHSFIFSTDTVWPNQISRRDRALPHLCCALTNLLWNKWWKGWAEKYHGIFEPLKMVNNTTGSVNFWENDQFAGNNDQKSWNFNVEFVLQQSPALLSSTRRQCGRCFEQTWNPPGPKMTSSRLTIQCLCAVIILSAETVKKKDKNHEHNNNNNTESKQQQHAFHNKNQKTIKENVFQKGQRRLKRAALTEPSEQIWATEGKSSFHFVVQHFFYQTSSDAIFDFYTY